MTTATRDTTSNMDGDGFVGEDGVSRPLEAHRAHLRAYFDAAVDPASGRHDEDYASVLRGKLSALPKPPSRSVRQKPAGSTRLHVILDRPEDIEAWRTFRKDAPAQLSALEAGDLTDEGAALLRALAARAAAVVASGR